ncbi:MAG: glutamate-cysteine ligase family protein [Thermodesulfovibrionales bacterium]
MAAAKPRLRLFEGYGIEIEYALVARESLDVLSIADRVLRAKAGRTSNDAENGPAGWSNEFMLHVMELKNSEPSPSLRGLAPMFQRQVREINRILAAMGGRLMPTGMHPWMDPRREARLWPHRNRRIYETYDRIFGCRSHGWANIQSIHLNLPFADDGELRGLHAAARLLIPLMPAIAASSPIVEGRVTGLMDSRLAFYRENQLLVPSIAGPVVPEEAGLGRAEYRRTILGRMYEDIAPHDPRGVLRHEWLNSRGAVPRFERNALEIRVLDVQECPASELAVTAAVASALRALVEGRLAPPEEQAAWPLEPLLGIFDETVRRADKAIIKDRRYLRALGLEAGKARAGELWRHLVETTLPRRAAEPAVMEALGLILGEGPLSRRIIRATGTSPSMKRLRDVYGKLCDCLERGEPFAG